jgi:predicted RNase H-like HicB family nuclease
MDAAMIRLPDAHRRPRAIRRNGTLKYTIILTRGNEGGFVARVPALPGCVSQGRTRRETIRNVKEAVSVYIEALVEDGLPVPREVDNEVVKVEVTAR